MRLTIGGELNPIISSINSGGREQPQPYLATNAPNDVRAASPFGGRPALERGALSAGSRWTLSTFGSSNKPAHRAHHAPLRPGISDHGG